MDQKTMILDAINRLVEADPNFAHNITRLADLAEKSQFIYNQAVNKLKSL